MSSVGLGHPVASSLLLGYGKDVLQIEWVNFNWSYIGWEGDRIRSYPEGILILAVLTTRRNTNWSNRLNRTTDKKAQCFSFPWYVDIEDTRRRPIGSDIGSQMNLSGKERAKKSTAIGAFRFDQHSKSLLLFSSSASIRMSAEDKALSLHPRQFGIKSNTREKVVFFRQKSGCRNGGKSNKFFCQFYTREHKSCDESFFFLLKFFFSRRSNEQEETAGFLCWRHLNHFLFGL